MKYTLANPFSYLAKGNTKCTVHNYLIVVLGK